MKSILSKAKEQAELTKKQLQKGVEGYVPCVVIANTYIDFGNLHHQDQVRYGHYY
jgi:hypothetical protein